MCKNLSPQYLAVMVLILVALACQTATPDPTLTPIPTYTFVPISSANPWPEEITDPKGATMRLVPAGTFTMGSENGASEEQPIHEVYLDSYYMDAYEVANALYKACAEAGVCDPPEHTDRFDNPKYANHPVIWVDWHMAKTYCEWRGAQLPTEAQWEKAARGTDGRTYPWGERIDCEKANYFDCNKVDTAPVGSYESGKSPYGIYDLAGNVWEWVADWYSTTYYQVSPLENPLGPGSGQFRVQRGGAWNRDGYNVRSAYRYASDPALSSDVAGFRCSRSLP
ncbi:MAG: formylglycine-generating enzyme family protein [Chloroflexota bacterium]